MKQALRHLIVISILIGGIMGLASLLGSHPELARNPPPVLRDASLLIVIIGVGGMFLLSPFSEILNVITVPLGYQWLSCPYCPDVSLRRITWADCDHCGTRHRTNFGAAKYKDGDEYRFCDWDCLTTWKQEDPTHQEESS